MSQDNADVLAEFVKLRNEFRQLTSKVERVDFAAARSAQGLDEFETALGELAERLAAAGAAPDGGTPPGAAAANAASAPAAGDAEALDQINMDVLYEWMEANIGEWAQRKLPRTPGNAAFCWCSQWYEHPEVVTVLWALRRAWLEAVVQPGAAMAVYLRDYFYPLTRAVTDPVGPMHACTPEEHKDSPFVPIFPDDQP